MTVLFRHAAEIDALGNCEITSLNDTGYVDTVNQAIVEHFADSSCRRSIGITTGVAGTVGTPLIFALCNLLAQ